MVIHSLLQQLSDDGFGTVGTTLQIGVLPVDANGNPRTGVALTPRGLPVTRTDTYQQAVDFYVRDTNPLTASNTAQDLLEYLQDSFADICTLPALSGITNETFSNVTITPTSSVEYVGIDDNSGVTFVVSGDVRYTKDN